MAQTITNERFWLTAPDYVQNTSWIFCRQLIPNFSAVYSSPTPQLSKLALCFWFVRLVWPLSNDRASFNRVSYKTKTNVITLANQKDGDNPVNQSKLEEITRIADTKRGKMCTREPQLVLVSLVIGWKSGARTLNQSLSEVMKNQSNSLITFGTQLKTALSKFQNILHHSASEFALKCSLKGAYHLAKIPVEK